eukprot:snap_masked-scaffold_8-processed-gene-8.25-mRNA-1 protein AED:1.00 eAED:1.00 QI:0/-1/0/0/-1/1/1/0/270
MEMSELRSPTSQVSNLWSEPEEEPFYEGNGVSVSCNKRPSRRDYMDSDEEAQMSVIEYEEKVSNSANIGEELEEILIKARDQFQQYRDEADLELLERKERIKFLEKQIHQDKKEVEKYQEEFSIIDKEEKISRENLLKCSKLLQVYQESVVSQGQAEQSENVDPKRIIENILKEVKSRMGNILQEDRSLEDFLGLTVRKREDEMELIFNNDSTRKICTISCTSTVDAKFKVKPKSFENVLPEEYRKEITCGERELINVVTGICRSLSIAA